MIDIKTLCRLISVTMLMSFLGGCATVTTYPWGQQVEFGGYLFDISSASREKSFSNGVNQTTTAIDNFVIVGVTVVNRTGVAQPRHFQPVFRLKDASGAIYEADLEKTMMINMGRDGRLSFFQSMNPNTRYFQQIVFDVPTQNYMLQVLTPSRAQVGFGGSITSSGSYFLYDLSAQL